MKSVFRFAVLILAIFNAAGVHAADDVEAALQDMRQAITIPQVVLDYCSREYPAYAENLRVAFDIWRKRHADLIFEIEARADRFARRATKRGEENAADAGRDNMIMQFQKRYEEKLRRVPEAESRPACARYGTELTNGGVNVSDLEKMFAVQLKLIRGKDASPGSN